MTVKEIIKQELDRLPEDVLEEILDFIQVMESKMDRNTLVEAFQRLSVDSFQNIWDNEEDAVYDNL